MANIMRIPVAQYGVSPGVGTKAKSFRYIRVDDVIFAESDGYPGSKLALTYFQGTNNSASQLFLWEAEVGKSSMTETAINKINEALLANANKPGKIIDIEDLVNIDGATFNVSGVKGVRTLPGPTTNQP
tara:strand:- start:3180 stop:3566 length:387 start_codon:yes stop_codon:yes gene_type:complete